MEETINFDIDFKHLDIEQLKKIKNIVENYQINEICNRIKTEDKVIIKYDKKTIEMNNDYIYQIKSIRNKYYRQLFSLLDAITPTELLKDPGFEDSSEILYLNNYMQKSVFIKMALINYIGTFYFDNIFTLSENAMLKLGIFRYDCNNLNNSPRDISDVLGMYCHYNEKIFELLESEVSKQDLEEMKKCKRFILICPELINKFCKDNFERFKDPEITDIAQLFEIVFEEVLFHEIGHGVFDYIHDEYNESRADYFASLTSDGTLDKVIGIHYDIIGLIYSLFYIDSDIIKIEDYVYDLKEKAEYKE